MEHESRVVMAKKVAAAWLARVAAPEFRFEILHGHREGRKLVSLLKMSREGKAHGSGAPSLPDLGIEEQYDKVVVWTGDRQGAIALDKYLEGRGYVTSGVW